MICFQFTFRILIALILIIWLVKCGIQLERQDSNQFLEIMNVHSLGGKLPSHYRYFVTIMNIHCPGGKLPSHYLYFIPIMNVDCTEGKLPSHYRYFIPINCHIPRLCSTLYHISEGDAKPGSQIQTRLSPSIDPLHQWCGFVRNDPF